MNRFEQGIKSVIIVIVLLTAGSSIKVQAQLPSKTDAEEAGLTGEVRSVKTFEGKISESFGELTVEIGSTPSMEEEYDIKGNLTGYHNGYDVHNVYTYDSLGNLLRKSVDVKTYLYQYNQQGKLIEEGVYSVYGRTIRKVLYEYNSVGNLQEVNEYSQDGGLEWKTLYKYNTRASLQEKSIYDSEGALKSLSKYSYDSNGKCLGLVFNSSNGKHYEKYDSRGLLLESRHGGDTTRYTYDSEGILVEKVYRSNSEYNHVYDIKDEYGRSPVYNRSVTKYDHKGNQIELCKYNYKKLLSKKIYTYEYDSAGNWIEKSEYDESPNRLKRLESFIEREIRYHTEVEEEVEEEENPEYPGGEEARLKFLQENIVYPKIALETGLEGRVQVSFVVEPDGRITNVELLRGRAPSLDEEALRVTKLMPRWKPGKQQGEAVRVQYQMPITFTLN
jgi:TonB family protein